MSTLPITPFNGHAYDHTTEIDFPCRVIGVSAEAGALYPKFVVIHDDDGELRIAFADSIGANHDDPGAEWLEDFYEAVNLDRTAKSQPSTS